MSSLRRLIFIVTGAGLVNGQAGISALPACGQTCVTNMINDAALGCTGDALSCLCTKPDFGFGIRDCADQACGVAVASTITSFASAMCATATLATAVVTPTTTTSSTPPPPPPTSTSTSLATISSSVTSSSLGAPIVQSTTTQPASSTTTTSSAASGAVSEAAASTTASASSTTSPAASDTATPSIGLSIAAKAGIGAGAAAGAVVFLTLLLFALHRCKQNRKQGVSDGNIKDTMHISDPMPGSGRIYASAGAGLSELEMKSRRYEDMVPRREPRIMV